jgi:hypothetical protein
MPVGWMPEKMTLGGGRINGFSFGDADDAEDEDEDEDEL